MVVFAELVASNDVTDEQRKVYAIRLQREGRRLSAVIENALELQRLEAGRRDLDFAPVSIGSLLRRAVVAAGEDQRLPIQVKAPKHLPLVSGDAEAILKVLANFLSNARRFSPGGGAITIEARRDGDMIEISVRDHGIGIHAADVPKVFRKFYRADNGIHKRGPGAGVGLAINKRIVESHGGQVTAGSEGPGRGARFQFTLPASSNLPAADYVLIVECEAAFAKLLKNEFAAIGLDTLRACDADTAQQIVWKRAPRAMVLDVTQLGLSGGDFLARIGADVGTQLPVVVLAARELQPAELAALENVGVMAVLPKEAGAPQAAAALIAEALTPGLASS